MKAKLKGKISCIKRDPEASHLTELTIDLTGQVLDVLMSTAKESKLKGVFYLKPVIADQMKVGATLTITISDEDE